VPSSVTHRATKISIHNVSIHCADRGLILDERISTHYKDKIKKRKLQFFLLSALAPQSLSLSPFCVAGKGFAYIGSHGVGD
jgi:hypothetical protein